MKVLKAPNLIFDPSHKHFDYDRGLVASRKKDGNRGICIAGDLYSASMKIPRNEHLHELLAGLKDLCNRDAMVVDYEIYAPSISHHAELSGFVNSFSNPPPEDLGIYVFDAAPFSEWLDECIDLPYRYRIGIYQDVCDQLNTSTDNLFIPLVQQPLVDADHTQTLFEEALEAGDEGLMIRYLDIWHEGSRIRGGWYKHGRATPNQRVMFKMKNYITIEAVITWVIQRRKLKDTWPRKRDRNGHLIRPLEKEAYTLTDAIGAFQVKDVNGNVSEIGFGKGFDLEWRRKAWADFLQEPKTFIGRTVEILHMPHGAMKDGRLRGGRLVRFRDDITPPRKEGD